MTRSFLYVFTILSILSCESESTMKQLEVHGHRGCRGLLPENSIPAFKKAIELGVDVLEMDVVVSKDGIVVVSHEPFLNHEICTDLEGNEIEKTLEKDWNLYTMSFEEIQKCDCGSKPHPRFADQLKQQVSKPSLNQVLKLAAALNPEVKFNIELKSTPDYDTIFTPKPSEFVALVLHVLNAFDVYDQTILQSFDIRILREIRKQNPKLAIALLVDENEEIWNKIAALDVEVQPEIISPYFELLNQTIVRNLQKESFQVIPWTVNRIATMNQMIDFEVDGIITDYPDRLIKILSANN